MCISKAYFKHDLTIPERDWYVGDNALYSDKRSQRLPLVFMAPIYVPFENQLVQLDDNTTSIDLEKIIRERAGEKLNDVSLRIAINQKYQKEEIALQDGDEVVFIPPVQGG